MDSKGYLRAKIPQSHGDIILMHWLIMNTKGSKLQVDHKNGNRFDNRKNNLRIANDNGLNKNSMNRKKQKNNTSGHPGVIWHNRDKIWEVWLGYNNKLTYFGRFNDFEEAVKMRKSVEEKYFKEWSLDNSRNKEVI